MNLLYWILFGFIAGVVAQVIDPAPNNGGFLGSIVLGILGSLVGGFLGNVIFGIGITGFDITSMLLAVLGSLLILSLGRALTSRGVNR